MRNRLCDVCEEHIPHGAKYRRGTLSPKAAAGLLRGYAATVPDHRRLRRRTQRNSAYVASYDLKSPGYSPVQNTARSARQLDAAAAND